MFYEPIMRKRHLIEAYEFPGFRPKSIVTGVFGAPGVRVITLVRPGKKTPAAFADWKASLKWQRLKPYEKFLQMIERHWEGIAAFCSPKNKVSLGFLEGFNNKIRVIQRRAYGLRDEEYLRLKVLTCMLPEI